MSREVEEEWFSQLKFRINTIFFSIIVKEGDILIGNCSYDIDWKNRVGTIGIVIGE